ncbi:hypothetical protein [Clostridium sp.]
MKMVEFLATVKEEMKIEIPKAEWKAMGIRVGDVVCLSYLVEEGEGKENRSKEFLMERVK